MVLSDALVEGVSVGEGMTKSLLNPKRIYTIVCLQSI